MDIAQTYHRAGDKAWAALFGKPDAVIIGEIHVCGAHPKYEAAAILRYRPEYVLMEGFNTTEPKDNEEKVMFYGVANVNDLSSISGLKPEEMGIRPETIPDIKDAIKKENDFFDSLPEGARQAVKETLVDKGIVPKSYGQLLETPFYELNLNVNRVLARSINGEKERNPQESETLGELLKIVVGHVDYEDKDARRVARVVHAIAKVGAELAGCDSKKGHPTIDKDLPPKEYPNYVNELTGWIDRNDQQREIYMGRRIAEFAAKRKTDAPVIAIIGSDHVKKGSFVQDILDIAELNYRVLTPMRPLRIGRDEEAAYLRTLRKADQKSSDNSQTGTD